MVAPPIDLAICGSRYGFNIGISEEVVESMTEYLDKRARDFETRTPGPDVLTSTLAASMISMRMTLTLMMISRGY